MPIDPRIPLQAFAVEPFDPIQAYGRIQQLQALGDERKMRQLQMQQYQMQMDEIQRKRQQEQNVRDAYRVAAQTAQNGIQTTVPGMNIGGVQFPDRQQTVSGPMDRNVLYSELSKTSPELVPDIQHQFVTQDLAEQKARHDALVSELETQIKQGTIDKNKLEMFTNAMTDYGKLVGGVLMTDEANRPVAYKIGRNAALNHPNPILREIAANGPENYSPDLLPALQQGLTQAMSVSDIGERVFPKKEKASVEQQQQDAWLKRPGNKGKDAADFLVWKNRNSPTILKDSGDGSHTTPTIDQSQTDPNSQSILAQTGLSLNAFRLLTGAAGQLPRDKATRNAASNEAQKWANAKGVDVSTMASQYKTYNDVLSSNISRLNNSKIMEQEVVGTAQNLQDVVRDGDLSNLKFSNVVKIWAGQEVNDPMAQQYAVHLSQLRNELSAYFAATQGRSGNNITITDQRDAEQVIKQGIGMGGLNGIINAIHSSTSKMDTVMQSSVDRSRQAVWNLFGVGEKYKPTATQTNENKGGANPLDKFWTKGGK